MFAWWSECVSLLAGGAEGFIQRIVDPEMCFLLITYRHTAY